MANGQPDIFARALERSTPGFDSLISTIQQETQRINKNRQLAQERENQIQLAELKGNIQLANQLRAGEVEHENLMDRQEARQEDMLQREAISQENALDRIRLQHNLQTEQMQAESQSEMLDSFYDNYEDARDDAQRTEDNLTQEYSDLVSNGLLDSVPVVKPSPVDEEGRFYENYVVDGEGNKLMPVDQFEQVGEELKSLNGFVQQLKNSENLVETEDQGNIHVEGKEGTVTEYVTKGNAQDFLRKIQDMSLAEKRQMTQLVNMGKYGVANRSSFADHKNVVGREEDEEEEEGLIPGNRSRPGENFASAYSEIAGGKNPGGIVLPKDFLEKTGRDIPAFVRAINKKGERKTSIQDLINIQNELYDYAIEENIITADGELKSNGPNTPSQLNEQDRATYQALRDLNTIKAAFDNFKISDSEYPGTSASEFYLQQWNPNQPIKEAWVFGGKGDTDKKSPTNPKEFKVLEELSGQVNLQDIK